MFKSIIRAIFPPHNTPIEAAPPPVDQEPSQSPDKAPHSVKEIEGEYMTRRTNIFRDELESVPMDDLQRWKTDYTTLFNTVCSLAIEVELLRRKVRS